MDTLIVKYLLQEATSDEITDVNNWINKSEANKKKFEHFKFLWLESKKIEVNNTFDENLAWDNFKNVVENKKNTTKIIYASKNNWLIAAAAVLVVIVAGWYINIFFANANSNKNLLVKTNKNIFIDTLPDNSIVTLNKNSSIEYNSKFTEGNSRNIKLKGEAFFLVTANKEKPFVVTVNDVQIRVVGTSFNVKTINGQTEVIVKTGIVQVARNGKTVTLLPHEKTLTTKDLNILDKENTKDKLFNYYESNEFECEETPLWRLVEVLNDAYGANIVIGKKEIRNLTITTTFANEPLDNILKIIGTTFQLKITRKDTQFIIQ